MDRRPNTQALEPHDAKHQNFLVLGPWRHGSWSSSSRHLGNIQYGEPIGKEYRAQIEAKFFAHFLKDEPGQIFVRPRRYRQLSDRIEHMETLHPFSARQSEPTTPAPRRRGQARLEQAPTGEPTAYISDPADPVPYRHRPIQPTYSEGSEWYNWLTEDQRFVTSRKDVAVWKLPVPQEGPDH